MYRCSIQFPFFLTTPSSSTYLEHHHHQHLHWLDQLAHCQYQLQTTDQQCCINNGHCKQIRAFTWTCSLTNPSLSRLGHEAKIKWHHSTLSWAFTWPVLHPISSLFITLLHQAPVAQKLDSAIHRINHYSVDKCLKNQLHHQADRDLSGR